jgi:transposase
METTSPHTALASIGIDIGKEVFHIVGFGADGRIAFRRKIKRLALIDTFKKLPSCIVGPVIS